MCPFPGQRNNGIRRLKSIRIAAVRAHLSCCLSAFLRVLSLCISLAALTLPALGNAAESLPTDFKASFLLNARGLDIGVTQWSLSPLKGDRYIYTSHSEAIGVAKMFRDERIDERSEWRFKKGQIQALRYSYSRSGGKRNRNVKVDFDWRNAQVSNTLNGKSWKMPLQDGTLDKLNYLLALMNDLANGVRETSYAVADGGKTKTYQLKVVGEETIDTITGALETVIVQRTRKGKDRVTLVWCAPALGYLPVKIEHREDDGTLYLTLTELTGLKLQ